jgi:hypothetical protein
MLSSVESAFCQNAKEPAMISQLKCLVARSVFSAFVFIAFAGCGGSDVPSLADVSGTIQMDGKPLANASVTFIPENGRPSSGMTDSSGFYTMSYSEQADGVVPGPCRVMISTGKPGKENDDGESEPGTPETVPQEYNVDTSLVFDVQSGKSNTADFSLTGGGTVAATADGEESVEDSQIGHAESEE